MQDTLLKMNFTKQQLYFAIFTFIIYYIVVGWKIALLLIIAVGIHEYSHLLAARQIGLRTEGFFLIPFVGGVALISERYKSYRQQAIVALAGPIGGGLLALATAVAYILTRNPILGAGAAWMCYLNIFNLLPFSFMDGGQIMDTLIYSVNRTFGLFSKTFFTIIGLIVIWKLSIVLYVLMMVFGGTSLIKEFRDWKNYREGRTWLVSEGYLSLPTSLSKLDAAFTIGGWIFTFIVLILTIKFLGIDGSTAISNLIQK